jgi:hypothetical protein
MTTTYLAEPSAQPEPRIDTSKLNVELLTKIKEAILRHPDHFDMSTWTYQPYQNPGRIQDGNVFPCGTTACIAGWGGYILGLINPSVNEDGCIQEMVDVTALPEATKQIAPGIESMLDFDNAIDGRVHFSDVVAKALGLNCTGADLLYYRCFWPKEFYGRYKVAEQDEDHLGMAQIAADRIDHLVQHGE